MAVTQNVDLSGVPASATADATRLASEIVRQNQPVINRFVKVQRQEIETGGLDVHSSVLPLKDMSVYYSYVQGLEKMHYHLTPQVEAPPEIPQPEAPPEEPGPPAPGEPPETPALPQPPEGPEAPKVPEEKPPEEMKPPEEEKPEEEKKEGGKPDFLEIDIPIGLAVEFGDGAGDP